MLVARVAQPIYVILPPPNLGSMRCLSQRKYLNVSFCNAASRARALAKSNTHPVSLCQEEYVRLRRRQTLQIVFDYIYLDGAHLG